jgi:2'-5' RNA ligase
MAKSRYAVYLIPPYHLTRIVSEAHHLLRKQFGFEAADRFPVHCTVKGFFKKTDRPVSNLLFDLDNFFKTQTALKVAVENYRADPIGFGLSLMTLNDQPNQPLLDFREKLVRVTAPYIADDCDFREHDLDRPYHPHITFSFRDIPTIMYDNVFKWMEDGPDFTGTFQADTFHLLEFFSENWEGDWWESLTWRLLSTWRLKS